MKTTLLLTTVLCLLAGYAFSQPVCGSTVIHDQLMATDANYRKARLELNNKVREIISNQEQLQLNGSSSALAPIYTIPVVVHVVHIGGGIGAIDNPTDTRILNTINFLNEVYAGTYAGTSAPGAAGDIQINFALATRDPDCNATTGIVRVNGSAIPNYQANGVNAATVAGAAPITVINAVGWDPRHYYNVYVVHEIDNANGTSGQFIAGFAYFPGGNSDGTFMLATQMNVGSMTLPHEVGHALNLAHVFEGSTHNAMCPPNVNCNTQGDLVCDTDPISYNATMAGVINFNCRSGANSCNGGLPYNNRTESNIMNYLNYGLCGNIFTPGQKTRMLATMDALPARKSLTYSSAMSSLPPNSSYTPVNGTVCASTTGANGLSGGYAGLIDLSLNGRYFNSGSADVDAGYVNHIGSCLDVIQLTRGNMYGLEGTVYGFNREQIRAWIDYNNDGIFDNATEEIIHVNDIDDDPIEFMPFSGSFTVPPTATTGAILRMRVINNFSSNLGAQFTITDACYDPEYGQAEDFSVSISAALPVTYEYFKGAMHATFARLNWKTSYENNAARFEIERSYNGTSYEKIGTVEATNSPAGSQYFYDDRSFTGDIMHYRLRQVDKDDRAEYSSIVTLQAEEVTNSSILIVPNPVQNQCDIVINSPVRTIAHVQLVDAAGKTVFTQQANVFRRSVISVTSGVQKLPPGIYIARITVDGKLTTKKLVKK